MTTQITDFYSDGGQLLLATYPEWGQLPPFAAGLRAPPTDAPSDDYAHLEKTAAGGVDRYWPLTDVANTWLSALYFEGTFRGLEKNAAVSAAQKIRQACQVFQIPPPPSVIGCSQGKIPPAPVKEAHAQPTLPGGLPAGNRIECLEAQRVLLENWDRLDPTDRREVGLKMAKLAQAHVFTVAQQISEYSHEGLSDGTWTGALQMRLRHFDPLDAFKHEGTYKEKVAEAEGLEAKIAAVRSVDEALNLRQYWGQGIPDPVLSMVGPEKAVEFSWHHGNERVTETDLKKLPETAGYAALQQSFGPVLATRLMENPVGTFKKLSGHRKLIVARLAGYSLSNEGANRGL